MCCWRMLRTPNRWRKSLPVLLHNHHHLYYILYILYITYHGRLNSIFFITELSQLSQNGMWYLTHCNPDFYGVVGFMHNNQAILLFFMYLDFKLFLEWSFQYLSSNCIFNFRKTIIPNWYWNKNITRLLCFMLNVIKSWL